MKKIDFLIAAAIAASAAFIGCSEFAPEIDLDEDISTKTGPPIAFGVSTGTETSAQTSAETKTIYSGEVSAGWERIDWVQGDKISVYCWNATTSQYQYQNALYKISAPPVAEGKISRGQVTAENVILNWGGPGDYFFFAMSPGFTLFPPPPSGPVPNKTGFIWATFQEDGRAINIKANVPPNQESGCTPILTAYRKETAVSGQEYPTVSLDFNVEINTFKIQIVNDYSDNAPITLRTVRLRSGVENISGIYAIDYSGSYPPQKTYNFNTVAGAPQKTATYSVENNDGQVVLAKGQSHTVLIYTFPTNISKLTLEVESDRGLRKLELKNTRGEWIPFPAKKKYNLINIKVKEATSAP